MRAAGGEIAPYTPDPGSVPAPNGVPTRGQVQDFLEQYREDYREGRR